MAVREHIARIGNARQGGCGVLSCPAAIGRKILGDAAAKSLGAVGSRAITLVSAGSFVVVEFVGDEEERLPLLQIDSFQDVSVWSEQEEIRVGACLVLKN